MKRVWITGAGGLIGNYLIQTAPQFAPNWQVVGLTRSSLDLFDFDEVRTAFAEQNPAAVIHCAAMSKTPECEAKPELARKLNLEVTALLGDLARDIPFITYSSDLVFNGRSGPYDETSVVTPQSVYAETKVAAERIVLANSRHTVIRTSLNGGVSPTKDRGFNEQIKLAWQAGQTLSFFEDEFRQPLPAVVTARVTWELLQQRQAGLFHVAGAEHLSRVQIGQLLAARWPDVVAKYKVTSLKDYSGAPRSPDPFLDCSKVQKTLSFPLPGLASWLTAHPGEPF